jgi:chromatin remodeling complex protein RSC6
MPAKKKSAPKKKTTVKTTPVNVAPVEETVVPVETPVVSVETPVDAPIEENRFMVYEELATMKSRLKDLVAMTRELSSMVTSLEKRVSKDKRVADKQMKKKKTTNANGEKPLNGFSKPGNVSDHLREFMGLKQDELVARVDVTKFITKYCKDNGLNNPDDKRILKPDKKLQSLLKVEKDVELTYFNLQKYLKFHFPNKDGVYASN